MDQEAAKKLEELKEEYSRTKYNKATNKHLSMLRAKIAKIKKEMNSRKRRHGTGFTIRKSGDATVAIVGFPNAGKSTLFKALTGVESKVANYMFTTTDLIPGMLEYKNAKIQIFDLPGLIGGAYKGIGGGKEIASAIRSVDLILLVVDITSPSQAKEMLAELKGLNILPYSEREKIKMEPRERGGIELTVAKGAQVSKESISEVLNSFGIFNCKLYISSSVDEDELIDFISGKISYIRMLLVLNKIDLKPDYKHVAEALNAETGLHAVAVSADASLNLEELKESIFKELKLIRVYLKPKNGAVDYMNPMIMREGSTISDVASRIHSEIANELKFAYVTGPSVKFANQKVGAGHAVMDGDTVYLVYKF